MASHRVCCRQAQTSSDQHVPGLLSVNSTRVTEVSGADVWDLTRAEWMGRRQMRQIAAFLQKYVPGFADAYVVQSGVQVGVRETRRIKGDYRLTAADILRARKFEDVIARGTYPVDIHNPAGKGTILKKLPPRRGIRHSSALPAPPAGGESAGRRALRGRTRRTPLIG